MKPSQKVLRKWSANFAKSPLVDPDNRHFSRALAYQLFYGRNSAEYPDNFPQGFQRFYQAAHAITREEAIETVLRYLHFVGINLRNVNVEAYLSSPAGNHHILLRKTHFILKSLAHTDSIDIDSPYKTMYGDLDFLIRIETGQAQLTLFEAPLPELYGSQASLPEGYASDPTVQTFFGQVENSNKSFFITGKAGTGKSTFILYFTQHTAKTVVRMAFTGIAAITIALP